MQFTTITAILASAVLASAGPLDARQTATRSVVGTFFTNKNGCNPPSTRVSFTFVQGTPGACQNLAVPVNGAITDTNFTNNNLTRTSMSSLGMHQMVALLMINSSLLQQAMQPARLR